MQRKSRTSGILRPAEVRSLNTGTVLNLLRRYERMSRAELARNSGLTEGTISRIVSQLVAQSLVVESGVENSTGGRPATRLHLSDTPIAIGVEIRRWDTRFAVASLRGTLLETELHRTPPGIDAVISSTAENVRRIVSRYQRKRVLGIGVTARGIVDSSTGVVELGSAPGWVKIPLRARLESELGLSVFVDNDVRAATAAEYHYTNAGELAPNCLLYVSVNEGVGVGLMLDGEIYTGPSMSAGEFGQMVIADQGSTERHDRPGCLESLVSNTAICDRYATVRNRRSSAPGDSASRVRKLCQLAENGDPDATQVLQETARYLGLGISNMVWGLDPEVLVINSALNRIWPVVLEQINHQLPLPPEWPAARILSIKPSELGDDAVLIGAATLAFAPLFHTGPVLATAVAGGDHS